MYERNKRKNKSKSVQLSKQPLNLFIFSTNEVLATVILSTKKIITISCLRSHNKLILDEEIANKFFPLATLSYAET